MNCTSGFKIKERSHRNKTSTELHVENVLYAQLVTLETHLRNVE
jgi:hypothetical protein